MNRRSLISIVIALTLALNLTAQVAIPFTMTTELYNNNSVIVGSAGSKKWNNGIQFGSGFEGFNWNDKYVVINVSGIPDKLSFSTSASGSATDPAWYVSESTDNSSWSQVWGSTSKTNNDVSIQLSENTQYIKLCWSGNLSGTFANVAVSEAKYLKIPSNPELVVSQLNEPTVASFTVNYCNVAQLSVSSSDITLFTPDITTITESGIGHYGSKSISVTYLPKSVGTHEGTITISNGTETVLVPISGSCSKRTQIITWDKTKSIIAVGDKAANVATTSSELTLIYESSNPEVISIIDNELVALTAGTADITATQIGNEEWQSITSTHTFTTTVKEVQTISWTQDFYRLKIGDAPIELNATSTSLLPVSYRSDNTAVVSVEGNILTIVGIGETLLTAYQEGNESYAHTSLEKSIRVRIVSEGCDINAYYNSESHNLSKSPLDCILSGPGDKLSCTIRRSGWVINTVSIYEYYADGNSKMINSTYVGNTSPAVQEMKISDIQVSRKAVSIKISADNAGTVEAKQIEITQATYLETDQANLTFDAQVGTTYKKLLTVNYSNQPDIIMVSHTNPAFKLTNIDDFGKGCGDSGSHSIGIEYKADNVKNESDTITLTCGKTILEIPILAHGILLNQAISWAQTPTKLTLVESLALTATSSSSLAVTFASSDNKIAYIDETNTLIPVAEGTITLTATQAGNEQYEAAQLIERTIQFVKADVSIVTNPTASNLTYGQTLEESILSKGEASVAGQFMWTTPGTHPETGDNQTFEAIFTPTESTIYNPITLNITLNVARATQTIIWEQDLERIVNLENFVLEATSSSKLNVTFASSDETIATVNENNQITRLQDGSFEIIASQAGNENYEPATELRQWINFTTTKLNKLATVKTKVYPNPTTDLLNIQADQTIARIILINASGSVVLTKPSGALQQQVSLDHLAPGHYILRIEGAAGWQSTNTILKK